MKKFDELEEYIKKQAVAYKVADEEWNCDLIELNTFRVVVRFAISERFQADVKVVDRVLNGEDETADCEEDGDNYTDWHYMEILLDLMNEQIIKKELPEKTTLLYETWMLESRGFDPKLRGSDWCNYLV